MAANVEARIVLVAPAGLPPRRLAHRRPRRDRSPPPDHSGHEGIFTNGVIGYPPRAPRITGMSFRTVSVPSHRLEEHGRRPRSHGQDSSQPRARDTDRTTDPTRCLRRRIQPPPTSSAPASGAPRTRLTDPARAWVSATCAAQRNDSFRSTRTRRQTGPSADGLVALEYIGDGPSSHDLTSRLVFE
jgi:hypothetical protein